MMYRLVLPRLRKLALLPRLRKLALLPAWVWLLVCCWFAIGWQ